MKVHADVERISMQILPCMVQGGWEKILSLVS